MVRQTFIVIICLFSSTAAVSAHQPRLVGGEKSIQVQSPEISQAFYATLDGTPDQYIIKAAGEFELYLNLLVPDQPQAGKDFCAAVFQATPGGNFHLLFVLDGAAHPWSKFYEPFAGDRYLKGPEHSETVPAGSYRIQVSSPDNRGKYVLAVGRKEKFTAADYVAMIAVLPELKKFFGKSPLTAYFNLVGLYMLLALLPLLAAFTGLCWLFRRALARNNL